MAASWDHGAAGGGGVILYRIAWVLLLALNKGYWRVTIIGKEHIPPCHSPSTFSWGTT